MWVCNSLCYVGEANGLENGLGLFYFSELTINDRDRDPITDRDHFFGDRDRIAITFWKSDR